MPTARSVAGAMVTLTNEATGVSFSTETSDSGTYAFDLVQAGKYSVTIEKQGFKKFISQANPVNVNVPATINAALETGGLTETVTVQAGAEQVQTSTSGNIGSTIEQKTLEALPIVGTRGRNPLDLLNFQPGVVIGGNTGGAVNVNGSRDRAFNFTLDGIDINESTAGGSNFTPLRPNPDSVQEFQVVTSNFTAELGRSSGAQVSLVTRSGSNDFHGNAFEFYRTPRLDAKSYPITIARSAQRTVRAAHLRRQRRWSTLQSGIWRRRAELVERQGLLLRQPAIPACLRHAARDANGLHANSTARFVPLCYRPAKRAGGRQQPRVR